MKRDRDRDPFVEDDTLHKEIASLRSQLDSRTQRNALLEIRLLALLDALDDLQASSTLELAEAQRENGRLSRKLDAAHAALRASEREKERMGKAVMHLVHKVEANNDFTKWHASEISFSDDLAVRPPSFSHKPTLVDDEACSCAVSYNPALVTELTESLQQERASHKRAIEDSERRIASLHSRIAARDAEIARRALTCRCPLPKASQTSKLPRRISDEDHNFSLFHLQEMNRSLEHDVELLKQKKAGRERETSTKLERATQTTPPTPHAPFPPNPSASSTTAILQALESEITDLRGSLLELTEEKEGLRSLLQDELAVLDLDERLRRVKLEQCEGSGSPYDDADEVGGKLFDNEMEKSREEEDFQGVLVLEEECIRLMHSEERLQEELAHIREREKALDEENSRLRNELSVHQSVSAIDEHRADSGVQDGEPASYAPTPLLVFDTPHGRSSAVSPNFSPAFMNLPVISEGREAATAVDGSSIDRPQTPSEHDSASTQSSSPSCLNTPTSPTSAIVDATLIPLPDTPDDAEDDAELDDALLPENAENVDHRDLVWRAPSEAPVRDVTQDGNADELVALESNDTVPSPAFEQVSHLPSPPHYEAHLVPLPTSPRPDTEA